MVIAMLYVIRHQYLSACSNVFAKEFSQLSICLSRNMLVYNVITGPF